MVRDRNHPATPRLVGNSNHSSETPQRNNVYTQESRGPLPISVHAHQWKQFTTKQQNMTYDIQSQTENAQKVQALIMKK